MKLRKIRRRNPVARAVRTPQFRLRLVASAKLYSRKKQTGSATN